MFRTLNPRLSVLSLIFCAAMVCMCGHSTAFAQSTSADAATLSIPPELTKEQVDQMVARLSDQEVRQLLIQQLDKVAKPEPEPEAKEAYINRFVAGINRAERNIEAVVAGMAELPGLPSKLWRRISEDSTASTWGVLLKLLLFFAIGVGVEQLFRRMVTNVGQQNVPDEGLAFTVRLKLGLVRAVLDVVAIIIFILGTVIAWLVFELPTENADFLFTTLLSATIVWRLVATGLRAVLAPKLSGLRLANLNDTDARNAYTKLMILTGLVVFVMEAFREILIGFDFGGAILESVGLITSAIFIGTIVVFVWQIRANSQGTFVRDEAQNYLSRNWRVLCVIGVLFIYAFALSVSYATGERVLNQAIASLVLIGFIPIVDMGLRGWVSRFMGATEDEGTTLDLTKHAQTETQQSPPVQEAETQPQPVPTSLDQKPPPTEQSYERVIITNLRILLAVFSVLIFAEIWDINLFGFLQALIGERMAGILVNFSVTALLAYAVWGVVSTAVARIAGPAPQAGTPGDEGGGAGGSRLATVLPLFRKFLFITLLVMLVMIFLSSLGVNIGPLIAGAGILGLAIGFGAQTLIKDIVSGVFFLLDDAFRVGEYVTIGDTKGTVEKISVRSLRLRHHNGPLHTVPFGEIQTLTNWSRDWAIMKFDIRVPFETDVDMVRRLIKKVGIAMMDDEEFGPLMLAPLKSQGVNRMDDSSFIIRCKFTAIPGQQFYIRREAYARIQAAFEEKGIKFAPRRVIVETTTPLTPAAAAAAGAAAAAVTDEESAKQDQVKDEPG